MGLMEELKRNISEYSHPQDDLSGWGILGHQEVKGTLKVPIEMALSAVRGKAV